MWKGSNVYNSGFLSDHDCSLVCVVLCWPHGTSFVNMDAIVGSAGWSCARFCLAIRWMPNTRWKKKNGSRLQHLYSPCTGQAAIQSFHQRSTGTVPSLLSWSARYFIAKGAGGTIALPRCAPVSVAASKPVGGGVSYYLHKLKTLPKTT